MATDEIGRGASRTLWEHILAAPMVDSHEHLISAEEHGNWRIDVLQAVFHHYVHSDLLSAGAAKDSVDNLANGSPEDIGARFEAVKEAWLRVKHTSYGHASRIIAKEVFGIDEFTGEKFEEAQARVQRVPKTSRLEVLRNKANIDHVQIDAFQSELEPDSEDAGFFRYDLNAFSFATAELNMQALESSFGKALSSAADLRAYLERLFDSNAKKAVAVKTQHAYARTLDWEERTDDSATKALESLCRGEPLGEDGRRGLGDWALARTVELAQSYDLPVKIHTGYLAGNDNLDLERIRPSKLWKLFAKFPKVRFVLMHTGYPFGAEIVALAKNFGNVYADLCWSWSIDAYSTVDFVRRMIHACPSHKLFAFGGDTFYPEATVAFAKQARHGLGTALQAEIEEGYLSEKDAIELADQYMRKNQYECFRLSA